MTRLATNVLNEELCFMSPNTIRNIDGWARSSHGREIKSIYSMVRKPFGKWGR